MGYSAMKNTIVFFSHYTPLLLFDHLRTKQVDWNVLVARGY